MKQPHGGRVFRRPRATGRRADFDRLSGGIEGGGTAVSQTQASISTKYMFIGVFPRQPLEPYGLEGRSLAFRERQGRRELRCALRVSRLPVRLLLLIWLQFASARSGLLGIALLRPTRSSLPGSRERVAVGGRGEVLPNRGDTPEAETLPTLAQRCPFRYVCVSLHSPM
jgi:hypothetical protein